MTSEKATEKAIAMARESARINNRFIGSADGAHEYRIRHFMGTATTLEVHKP